MNELILPQPKILLPSQIDWHAGPAAELLREDVKDFSKKLWRELDRILLMASGKSAYRSALVKNSILGAVAFSAATTTYWALWTTAAATDMDAYHGGTAGEVSGGSYDRVSKTNNTTNFASISGDAAKVNSNDIQWPTATANWNSGSAIPQLAVFDGNLKTSGDNLELWGDITVAKAVLNGDTIKIATGDLSYTDE